MATQPDRKGATGCRPPKFVRESQWKSYPNPVWPRPDKDDVTVLFSYVERRKSFFLRAVLGRRGFKYKDMGDHVKEDVTWGKQYGNRMECNPMYFTSGAIIRALKGIESETGLSKEEIVRRYVFLSGGGQCGPCRYGMYPQEYMKVVNEAGFQGFRILIFSSDIGDPALPPDSALQFDLVFRIDLFLATLLADLVHVADCALRPRVSDRKALDALLLEVEQELFAAFNGPAYMIAVPAALRRVGRKLAAVPRSGGKIPLVFVTGEFFANLAHNDGNYHLRRFISEEGCEVIPGLMVQRILYDNWRRTQEAESGLAYARTDVEKEKWARSLGKQRNSNMIIRMFCRQWGAAMGTTGFGGRFDLHDLDELARLGEAYYNPRIFGGEGNLEVAEAVHYAGKVDGFISAKPFGCMPSSGVSDGVQALVMSLNPDLNFLSIETSGDNEISILSRVSMLLFKARQRVAGA